MTSMTYELRFTTYDTNTEKFSPSFAARQHQTRTISRLHSGFILTGELLSMKAKYQVYTEKKANVDHPRQSRTQTATAHSVNPTTFSTPELHAPRPSRQRTQLPDSRRIRNPRRNRTRSHRLRNTEALEIPKETRLLLPRQTTRRRRRPLEDIDLATPA